jgi:hypothetical protein
VSDKTNIDTRIDSSITVSSWHDSDFEICFEDAYDYGDVERYLKLDKAIILRDALDHHIDRFSSSVPDKQRRKEPE